MKLEIFGLFDDAAGAFLPPWYSVSEAMILRMLSELPADHQFRKYSDQYTLFRLGSFDQDTGEFSDCRPSALRVLKFVFAKGPVSVDSSENAHVA